MCYCRDLRKSLGQSDLLAVISIVVNDSTSYPFAGV